VQNVTVIVGLRLFRKANILQSRRWGGPAALFHGANAGFVDGGCQGKNFIEFVEQLEREEDLRT